MIRRISLFATLPLALALTTLLVVAKPAHAWFGSDLWNSITCVADINCTVRAAATSALNYAFNITVGKDYDKLTDADINQMANGTWNGGLSSTLGSTLASAYTNPPIDSLASAVKKGLANNILYNPVSAEETSTGEALLTPVLTVWSAMRDLAYGLFAIIMVAIGIMIIARKEVSPRLVVTLTSALPKIVMGLVLITFSYPIVAFFVDLMQYATEAMFFLAWNALHPSILSGAISPGGLSTLLSGYFSNIIGSVLNNLSLNSTVQAYAQSAATSEAALATFFAVVVLFLGLIIVGGILVIKLIFAWAWILIYTIFSPLLILFGTLPGQEGTITDLGKKILSKGLFFPLTVFFLLLAISFAINPFAFPLEAIISKGVSSGATTGTFLSALTGPILTIAMLVAAFKAQGLVEEALTGGGGKKKK